MKPPYFLTLLSTLVVALPQASKPETIKAENGSPAKLVDETAPLSPPPINSGSAQGYDYVGLVNLLGKTAKDLQQSANAVGGGAADPLGIAALIEKSKQQQLSPPASNSSNSSSSVSKPYDYAALAQALGQTAKNMRNPNATRGLNYTGFANLLESLSKGFSGADFTALNPFALIAQAGSAVSDLAMSALANALNPLHLPKSGGGKAGSPSSLPIATAPSVQVNGIKDRN